jgi:hypothetical protein
MLVAQVRELGGIGSVELRERPDPTPAAGQAVIRVRGAGCGRRTMGRHDDQRHLRTTCPALHSGV